MPAPRSRRLGEGLTPARRLLVALLVGVAGLGLELRLGDRPAWRGLELETLDWRFRWRGPIAPGPETVLVMIDDRSVAQAGAWPVPRQLVAAAVDRIAEAGARVIALDLLFAEAQAPVPPAVRDLLAQSVRLLPEDADELRRRLLDALGASGPDLELALALQRAGRVVTPYAFVFDPAQANIAGLPRWIRATAFRVRTDVAAAPVAAPAPQGLLVPAPQLASSGVSTGHVTLLLEPDGSLRTALPALTYRGEAYPSLPVEAVRAFLGLDRTDLVLERAAVRIGRLRLPLDPAGRHLVNHYGPPATVPTYSFAELMLGRVDPARLKDRIVVIGASATGAGDRFATPFTPRLPGAEFLATVIDNMLHDRALRRDDATRSLDLLAILALPLGTAFLAGRRSPWLSLLAVAAVLAGWAALATLAFVEARLWLAGTTPAVAAIAAGVGVEALRLAQERRRRAALERQRANLARYFPPPVVERLAASEPAHALEGMREATVMFVDIVGFTRIAETMTPTAAMDLLRRFHTLVEAAVFAHRGMVDKFLGDGAMACFGVPDPLPAAAAAALRAALALLDALAARDAFGEGGPRLKVGIGIHQGPVLMGDLGGATQVQFTVVGDTVNVASRLEALTRTALTPLIVSDAALAAARPHLDHGLLERLEPLPELTLRGRTDPIRAWRLLPAGRTPV